MLLAAVITLAPSEPTTAPAVLGYAAHAWFLQRIAAVDPALAARLHDEDGLRPFTVSDLYDTGPAHEGRVALTPERPCWLRLTALDPSMVAALERALPSPGEMLVLGGTPLRVQRVAASETEHPGAGRATYTELVQRYTLSAGPTPRKLTLRFASPTVFRLDGHDLPLPLPSLVFGSYLQKWNAFAPLTLPEDAQRYARECIALGRFELRSHLVSFKESERGEQVGFSGTVDFRLTVPDAY